ncbi:MAG: nitrous oxide reductase accessory protein NosL [Gemmatimonadaceae bacterium]
MMGARVLQFATLAAAVACAPGRPDPIAYDADDCAYCHMQISDERFGAALVTKKGRTIKFDGIDCLIDYYKKAAAANDVASVWVSDYRHPGTLLNADSARFIDLGEGRAPMGRRGLAAVATARDAAALGVIDISVIERWADLR